MEKQTRIILGLVGQPSGGKDTAAAYLIDKYGFVLVSTSDMIRDYIAKNNLGEPIRTLMQEVANKLRLENGPDYFVQLGLKTVGNKLVFTGMRNPSEVATLKKVGATIIEISAPIEVRYQRAIARKRVGENVSLEDFRRIEEKEFESTDPNNQNTGAVLKMADHTIINDGSLEELYQYLDLLMAQLGVKT